jgi:hypothetical protein
MTAILARIIANVSTDPTGEHRQESIVLCGGKKLSNILNKIDINRLICAVENLEDLERLYLESECEHDHCGLDELGTFGNANKNPGDYVFRICIEPSHGRSYLNLSADVPEDSEDFQTIRAIIKRRIEAQTEEVKAAWSVLSAKQAGKIPVEDLRSWVSTAERRKK